ncbi:DNA glycosylase, partial [Coprinopsis marcescibilis]
MLLFLNQLHRPLIRKSIRSGPQLLRHSSSEMPTTRSSSRLNAKPPQETQDQVVPQALTKIQSATPKGKRKISTAKTKTPTAKKSRTTSATDDSAQQEGTAATVPVNVANTKDDTPVPAVLSFDFEDAMEHLVNADSRFQDLFEKMTCRPFEQLEAVHPFRALSISILGQQISWRAARSITYKFIRLFNPSIPEEATDESRAAAMTLFPTPGQVAITEVPLLRTAGLSERKAQYIQDLAARFADGRLSTDKLLNANDEDLAEMLIQVKGIGRWTVDMFAIFSLRRPDILPVGDLGVQRGLARWYLSLYSASHSYSISPEKVLTPNRTPKHSKSVADGADGLPTPDPAHNLLADDSGGNVSGSSLLPVPFTPSINKTLAKTPKTSVPLPPGLTTAVLKSRVDAVCV